MSDREIPTSELARLAGVTTATLRKWKARGDLKLAPRSRSGAGRGNEAHWSPEAVKEVLRRASENRTTAYRRNEASGIAARSDETPQVAQPEARARPDAQNKGVSHD